MAGRPRTATSALRECVNLTEDDFVLRIYRSQSGQWTGKLIAGEEEIGEISNECHSPEEVTQAAYGSGIIPDRVDVEY